ARPHSPTVRDGPGPPAPTRSATATPLPPRPAEPSRTFTPPPTMAAVGPAASPAVSIRIPPSLRPSHSRSLGHFTVTPRAPSFSSASAAATATARLRPASAPAPRENRHRTEKVTLPPTAETQALPRLPRPPLS